MVAKGLLHFLSFGLVECSVGDFIDFPLVGSYICPNCMQLALIVHAELVFLLSRLHEQLLQFAETLDISLNGNISEFHLTNYSWSTTQYFVNRTENG